MNSSNLSHRRVRLLAIASIVMLLTSVFPLYPAAAEDPPVTTPTLDSLVISCAAEGTDSIKATIAVSNPQPADSAPSATVELYANTGGEPALLTDNSTSGVVQLTDVSVSVLVQLPPNSASIASSIIARASVAGDDSIAPVWSESTGLPIHASDAGSLCGTAPVTSSLDDGSETATSTATETATSTATETETATSTATETATSTATETTTATQTATSTATGTATATASATATQTATATPTTQYATVVNTGGANLRCRATPGNGTELGRFPAGSRVELRGSASSGWYPVVCPNGQDGYASGEYLRVDSTSTPTDPQPGDTTGVAVVNGTGGAGLRCRTEPVSGSIIGVYPDGTRLTMRGAVENGWAPVTCGGQSGWVSTQYARVESGGGTPTPTPGGDTGSGTGNHGTVVNTGGLGLRCRTAPVSGAVIIVVPEGTKLETRGAASNGWYPVICNGQAGYVSADYFSLSGGGTTTPPVSGGSKTAMVTGTGGGGLRCRTAPVDGGIITVMPEGALVDVRGDISNGWAPVKCAGQNGWASAAYLNFNVSGGGTGELWMDVDLGDQYMRVYRGNTVIASTYVSTGRRGFDTPTGTYYINHKLRSQTMSGVLGGEYYYVPNVPWVMYFTNRGHAIHGAYWHNNFGSVMSHGCINLPVSFAEWLYSVTPYGARLRIHW